MQKGTEHLPTHGNEDYNGTEDMVRNEILHLEAPIVIAVCLQYVTHFRLNKLPHTIYWNSPVSFF